jgi:hypothetical protein
MNIMIMGAVYEVDTVASRTIRAGTVAPSLARGNHSLAGLHCRLDRRGFCAGEMRIVGSDLPQCRPAPDPTLRGLAADTDPSRQLDFMQRTLLSPPNLEQLIRLTDLDNGIRTPRKRRLCSNASPLISKSDR